VVRVHAGPGRFRGFAAEAAARLAVAEATLGRGVGENYEAGRLGTRPLQRPLPSRGFSRETARPRDRVRDERFHLRRRRRHFNETPIQPGDSLARVPLGLAIDVLHDGSESSRADALDVVPFRPTDAALAAELLARPDDRAPTLPPLDQPREACRRVDAHDDVQMRSHRAEREKRRTLLASDRRQEAPQKRYEGRRDRRLALARGPRDVKVKAVTHVQRSIRRTRGANPSRAPRTRTLRVA
jgi:hypothetical protein